MDERLQIEEGLFTALWEKYFKRKRLLTGTAELSN